MPEDEKLADRRPTDHRRGEVYAAERMVFGLFDGVGSTRSVLLAGTEITLPVEARFASLDSISDYVERVRAMPVVADRFERATVPVRVRARRSAAAATYESGGGAGIIAIPVDVAAGRWALRELVVLHELAHHFDDSGGAAHGRGFRAALVELAALVLGPEAGYAYRVIFGDSGL
ncbi:TIGR04338 family metallohydrolase [Gordonia defluvii]|uniref:TIGR04338 family metallohydrolase n=1 Tax=Gordonia defluvii TaxID=283718 RepID=A0ABP6LLB9_9ACTN|nr:TIGR04338 family metallohydrolase [Gordonia sp. UBA5067]